MSQYPTKVYLDNQIVDQIDAKISVFDRGFLFGDGIYEVMVKIDGKILYEQEHMDRFKQCLKKINIPFRTEDLPEKISDLLQASQLSDADCLIYFQVTRGTAPRKHAFPDNIEPSFVMYALPISLPDINQDHLSVITMPDFRWSRCDIKMISLLGTVMANDEATKQGAYEAVFIREGKVTEASHCNVFFAKDDIVYTHPVNEFILDGVTRRIVLSLCDDLGIVVKEEAVDQANITRMDEAFLTGTTTQIASIRQIDQHYFYQGDAIGSTTKKLQAAFYEHRKQLEPIIDGQDV